MKLIKPIALLFSLIGLLDSGWCVAGETTQTIKITGKLIPAPCTVTFENSLEFNLGDISMQNLSNKEHPLKIRIVCPSDSLVKLNVQDNVNVRDNLVESDGPAQFRLRSKQNEQVVGYYSIFPEGWTGVKKGKVDQLDELGVVDEANLKVVEEGLHTESVEKTGLVSGKSYVFALETEPQKSVNSFTGTQLNGVFKIKILPLTQSDVEGEIYGEAVITFIHP